MARLVFVNEISNQQFSKLYRDSKGFNPKLNPNHTSYDADESAGSYLLAGGKSLIEKNPGLTNKLI